MEEGKDGGGLGLWIGLPLGLLVVMFLAGSLLPPSDCSVVHNDSNPGRTAFAFVAGVCALIAGVAAVSRVAAMWQAGAYSERDAWLGGLASLAAVVGAGIGGRNSGESALGGFLLAGLVLMVVSLFALVVAVFMRKRTEEVGALVPIYLFGACLTYPLLAWILLDLNTHPLC